MPSCALPQCDLSFALEEDSSCKSKMPSQEVASCSPTRQKRSGQETERQTDGVTHPRLDCMHLSSNRGNRCSPRALREGFGNSQQHHSAANPLSVSGCVAPLHEPFMSYSFSVFLCSVTWVGCQALSCSSAFKASPHYIGLHKIAGRGAQLE